MINNIGGSMAQRFNKMILLQQQMQSKQTKKVQLKHDIPCQYSPFSEAFLWSKWPKDE